MKNSLLTANLSLFLVFLWSIFPVFTIAQELSSEGRSHLDKAEVYIEMAQNETEWRLAVAELESLVRSDPEYSEAYLLLGDVYSNIKTAEALSKAKSNYVTYLALKPSETASIQAKIARTEAAFAIYEARRQDEFFKALQGKWSPNIDGWGNARHDIEFRYDGEQVLLSYYSSIVFYQGGEREGLTSTCCPLYDSASQQLICSYVNVGIWIEDDDISTDERLVIPYQENIEDALIVYVRYPTGNMIRDVFHRHR